MQSAELIDSSGKDKNLFMDDEFSINEKRNPFSNNNNNSKLLNTQKEENNDQFSAILYRQHSLIEKDMQPEPYRTNNKTLGTPLIDDSHSKDGNDANIENDQEMGISDLLDVKDNNNPNNQRNNDMI